MLRHLRCIVEQLVYVDLKGLISFFFRPEVNIKPWEPLLKDLKRSNERIKWKDREPYAYWKGNFGVAATRKDLRKCNLSKNKDWNARLYAQVCVLETGFLDSTPFGNSTLINKSQ